LPSFSLLPRLPERPCCLRRGSLSPPPLPLPHEDSWWNLGEMKRRN
jgi:hypothetical protein